LARRVEAERKAKEWSYQALANHMQQVGYPIQPSAIHKITSAGRRITLDEAIAYAQVFRIPLDELSLPLEVARSKELRSVWDQLQRNQADLIALHQERVEKEAPLHEREAALMQRIADMAKSNPELKNLLLDLLAESNEKYAHPMPVARFMKAFSVYEERADGEQS